MTPYAVNRNLRKVPLLRWNGDTRRLHVTIYGDEVVTYNTGGIPRCHREQANENKRDHGSELRDEPK